MTQMATIKPNRELDNHQLEKRTLVLAALKVNSLTFLVIQMAISMEASKKWEAVGGFEKRLTSQITRAALTIDLQFVS
ncbi:hypothetical protein [Parasphingorhabdus cellanae]|uniref:Uncharacterized protein n=1 Tax=Parasphingorhabdus cellanae TaxID=2806553 RepID=A0ABX7T9U5_9SPHN|nr:hypothetical protein [Parasphingorhabdus cellanae]QTD56893.1 hypothetical protein J4G78_04790 [Parasphingorhabdus cellanae]